VTVRDIMVLEVLTNLYQKLSGGWCHKIMFKIVLISNFFNNKSKDYQDSNCVLSEDSQC
jgi:hypothetical protein